MEQFGPPWVLALSPMANVYGPIGIPLCELLNICFAAKTANFNQPFWSYALDAQISLKFISLFFVNSLLNTTKFQYKVGNFGKIWHRKKIFIGFHRNFDGKNWSDEYEAISGIQSFTV